MDDRVWAIIIITINIRDVCVLQIETARGKTAAFATAQGSVEINDAT